MKFEDFKVGQRVTSGSYGVPGIVTQISYPYVFFSWESREGYRTDCKNPNTFYDIRLIEDVPVEDAVSLKIKLLWNNSKFVQKNPQLAY